MVLLTHDQAKGVTKGCLSPGQAVVWQVNVLCCAIYVAASNPSGLKTQKGESLIFSKDDTLNLFALTIRISCSLFYCFSIKNKLN